MSDKLKILCLSPYPIEAASARLRVLQFLPYLNSVGVDVTYHPFMDSRFFSRFYQPNRRFQKSMQLLGSGLRRLRDVQRAKDYDLVLIHREAALVGPPLIEHMIARFIKKPIVFDFDDATYVLDISPSYQNMARLVGLVKYPQKIPKIIGISRSVIAGNLHLENYAKDYNSNVTVIPTVVDDEIIKPINNRQHNDSDPLVLGWIGTPSTFRYLESLAPVLQNVARRHSIILRIVGAGKSFSIPGVTTDYRSWGLQSELSDLQSFDIGLYPVSDDIWSMGKSGFKAVQYMAVGIPMVCSPVGAVCDIVQNNATGLFATHHDEWESQLCHLIEDAELRRNMGRKGRENVQNWYCVRHQAPRIHNTLLESV